jgi:hypothetical protein
MSSSQNPDPQPTFTPRSEKESICMFCYLTIRADKYLPLKAAEEIHADVCLAKPGSPVRYVLL